MDQPPRICQTCRHFQQSPLPHKGWCRNPILYTARDQHLVPTRGIDCARAYGDLWEPSSSAVAAPTPAAPQPRLSLIHELLPGLSRLQPPSARTIVGACLAVAVALLFGLNAGWPVGASPAQPDSPAPLRSVVTVSPLVTPSATPTSEPSPTPSPTATTPPTPSPTPTAPPTATPTLAPSPTATQQATSTAPTPALPALVTVTAGPPPAAGALRVGERAVVRVTSDPPRLRLRKAAGLDHPIVGRVQNGETVRILAGPTSADGYVWWKVESGDVTGWAAAPFLEAKT